MCILLVRSQGDAPVVASETVVLVKRPTFSCLISCFFLSKSAVPRRSLMVSLYWSRRVSRGSPLAGGGSAHDLQELALQLVGPSLLFEVIRGVEDLGDRPRDHALRLQCLRTEAGSASAGDCAR